MQPHLSYAILVWGYKCNRLVKLQKRLVRIITRSKYNAHTDPLFKRTGILKVANTLDLNALKFYYKYLHGKLLSYFYSFNIVTQGHLQHAAKWANQNWAHTSRILWQQTENTGLSKLSPAPLIRKNSCPQHSGFLVRHQISFPKLISNRVLHCQLLHLSPQSPINEMHIYFCDLRWRWRLGLWRLGGHPDSPNGQPYRGCCCLIFIGYCYIFMFLYLCTENYNSCITRKPVHYTCGPAVAGQCRPGIGPRRFA